MGVRNTDIKAYRKVRAYYHRTHVAWSFNRSTYVYNTVKAFFLSIYSEVKEKGSWNGWELVVTRSRRGTKGRIYRVVNPELGISIESKSIFVNRRVQFDPRADMPILIRIYKRPWDGYKLSAGTFLSAFERANGLDLEPPEPLVIEVSKRYDDNTGNYWTRVDAFVTGHPTQAVEAVRWFFSQLQKPVYMEEADGPRIIRIEQFLRVHERAEGRMREALKALHKRWGITKKDVTTKHDPESGDEDEEGRDVTFVYRIGRAYFFTKVRADIKLYRKPNYRYPAEHYTDHPKLEIVHYHVPWEKVDEVIKEGQQVMASVVYVARAYDDLIPDPDHPVSGEVPPHALIVKTMLKKRLEIAEAKARELKTLGLDEVSIEIVKALFGGILTSKRLQLIAERAGVSVRTVQRRLEKTLIPEGYVLRFPIGKGKTRTYVYTLNFDRFAPDEEAPVIPFERVALNVAREEAKELAEAGLTMTSALVYVLVKNGFRSSKAIARLLGVSDRAVRYHLEALASRGLVVQKRRGIWEVNGYEPAALAALEAGAAGFISQPQQLRR